MSVNTTTDTRYLNTIGYKRKNPGNLMVHSIPYSGKVVVKDKSGPVTFISMEKGLRALAMDIKMKSKTIFSITDILTLYAPSSENNTAVYIKYVATKTGKGATEKLVYNDAVYIALMQAIISMEIGFGTCPFTEEQLQTAVTAAKTSE
ncbi:hypothetical protein C8P66_105196 [Humitalea rosea]|uniref:Uncharacterized protein n=1 Tax=Humitalea rosea TaxID=990373 RepID=A0A2W7J996_9PROT|nr:hypothetical protein [Humitalea rosea]PZW48446.1 hypothetical protein C8P66_105196 [Humitalea rosea]